MRQRSALSLSRVAVAGSVLGLLALALASCAPRAGFDPQRYPRAHKVLQVDDWHGVQVLDPYRWLEEEQDPAVQEWIAAENRLTHRALAPFENTRGQIARELEAVYGVDSVSNFVVRKGRYFQTKRAGLENHRRVFVREGSFTAEPRVVLDPNTFSKDATVALDWWFPSPDGSLIAYGKSASGSERSTLFVRDVATGKDLTDVIPFTQYCYVAWNRAGTGFYYNRGPNPADVPKGEENFHMRVYFHKVGTRYEEDRYVWGEGRPVDEEPQAYSSSDHEYVLLNFYRDPAEDDLFFKRLDDDEPFQPVAAGIGAITHGNVVDGQLFLHTNHQAPRYRICTTSVERPGPQHWRDLIPQQRGVISGFAVIDRKLIVQVSEDVHSRLLVYELDGTLIREIELPGIGTVSGLKGSLDKPDLFFTFASWVTPTAVYHYDLRRGELTKLHQRACPVELAKYEAKQIWYASKDGTQVPMFVVARKDVQLDGNNPTLLYGYGGFNSSFFPYYRPRIIPFLERGGVWVLANIRGGGEFGQDWHNGGRRQDKQKCFDDFYAAGEKLIELGYTNPSKLACKGGSNGGLLIGAAVTQRPDLFQAALSQVPLMDMVRFYKWGMGAQWVYEYGNPEDPEEFPWIWDYSPYHRVLDGVDYPATLIVTAESDNRVDTAHAFKMTARMQEATSGTRPILLRVERKAGHGAGKPLSMTIQHQSEDWAFLMWQLGMLD